MSTTEKRPMAEKHEWEVEGREKLIVSFDPDNERNPFLYPALPDNVHWHSALAVEVLRLRQERDMNAMSSEEGCEIINELSSALAVLCGENLKPCMSPCGGHLRENANKVVKAALDAWRALQEGNRRAAERIAELEREKEAAGREQAEFVGAMISCLGLDIEAIHRAGKNVGNEMCNAVDRLVDRLKEVEHG